MCDRDVPNLLVDVGMVGYNTMGGAKSHQKSCCVTDHYNAHTSTRVKAVDHQVVIRQEVFRMLWQSDKESSRSKDNVMTIVDPCQSDP